jgi:hypothetical protein
VAKHDRVLVTLSEAALRFEVSPATIRAWLRGGRLESYRIEEDRRVYVALDSLCGPW